LGVDFSTPLWYYNKMEKVCKKCKDTKKLEEFSIRSDSGNYRHSCKVCISSQRSSFRLDNIERFKENDRRYHKENAESKKKTTREWYLNNKEQALGYAKNYREENRELIRKNDSQFYENNKERIKKEKSE